MDRPSTFLEIPEKMMSTSMCSVLMVDMSSFQTLVGELVLRKGLGQTKELAESHLNRSFPSVRLRLPLHWQRTRPRIRQLECPANSVPVGMRHTGMEGAGNGQGKEAHA